MSIFLDYSYVLKCLVLVEGKGTAWRGAGEVNLCAGLYLDLSGCDALFSSRFSWHNSHPVWVLLPC